LGAMIVQTVSRRCSRALTLPSPASGRGFLEDASPASGRGFLRIAWPI
jgi:hypothetical protein